MKVVKFGGSSLANAEQFKKYANVKFIKGVASKTDIVGLIEKEGVFVEELPLTYQKTDFAKITKTRQTIKTEKRINIFTSPGSRKHPHFGDSNYGSLAW